jgi:hypothetical protein
MAGFLKGALIELGKGPLLPVPIVIVFQFNPETMTHTWTQPEAAPAGANSTVTNPYAVFHDPGESFGLTLVLDGNDSIANGTASAATALTSGVYTRIAALEMLLFPAGPVQNLVGTATAAAASAVSAVASAAGAGAVEAKQQVPDKQLNTVLFVWGPGRIVPVRITGMTVAEKLYDARLNPTYAEVQISMRVPTDEELRAMGDGAKVATTALKYTQGLRKALATADLANAAESVVGLWPF